MEFLAWVGWYCRYVVAWCLFALGAFLPTQIRGWTGRQRTLLGTYLGFLFPVVGILAALAWVEVARPPAPLTNWPEDYAAYAAMLLGRLNAVLPLALSALPWIALADKFLGFEWVGKVFEQLSKSRSR